MEDWTSYPPRSPASAQSGIPSDSDDDDDRPVPRVYPGTWSKNVEDGQKDPKKDIQLAPVVDSGCRGLPCGGPRREDDEDGRGGRKSWRDTLLGLGRSGWDAQPQGSSSRRRSRSPSTPRQTESSRGRRSSTRRADKTPTMTTRVALLHAPSRCVMARPEGSSTSTRSLSSLPVLRESPLRPRLLTA